jgi:ATP-dependent helicase/nuclease subunit B
MNLLVQGILMKIIFGLHADGMNPHIKENNIGVKTVGPNGFLNLLEAQLGIPVKAVSHTSRVISYSKRIEASGITGKFFEKSYLLDQFNVAAELLSWRDQWYLAGWNSLINSPDQKRLFDIAAIENETHIALALSEGERLQVVLSALNNQKTQITKLQLIDSKCFFPKQWRHVISLFKGEQLDEVSSNAVEGSDLNLLQKMLIALQNGEAELNASNQVVKQTLKGDGSVQLIKSGSKSVSSLAVASFLRSSTTSTALLSNNGVELDEAFESINSPRQGFKQYSSARPLLQLLPLAVDLLWEPLNPETLLEFLLLPYAPISRGLRRALASVVAECPGINGLHWRLTIEKLLENDDELSKNKVQAEIDQWLSPVRFEVSDGLPIDRLKQRVELLTEWIGKRLTLDMSDNELTLFRAAHNQVSELLLVLQQFDDQTQKLPIEQVHYLIEQVTGSGTDLVDRYAECLPEHNNYLVAATTPSTFINYFDTVIWWDIQGGKMPANALSKSEKACLSEHGVDLIIPETLYQLEAKNSMKPILAAKNKLMLIVHDNCENKHPLLDQINSCIENLEQITLDDSLLAGNDLTDRNKSTEHIQFKALPAYRRWWEIKAEKTLGKREKESFSSLEMMFKSPYQWVLNYKARLRSDSLTEISDGNLLKGSLVHHLYELFFIQNKQFLTDENLDNTFINKWFDEWFNKLLHEEGLVLLQPGRSIEKTRFEETTRRSLFELIRQLRAANVVEIEMEGDNEGHFFGGTLFGSIDVRVVNKQGQEAIVDIKWGGKKYKEKDLKENTHLQLVIYSYLRDLKLKSQGWPPVAYFIIDDSTLLCQNNDFFPNAWVVNKDSDENIKQVWQRIKHTWKWRQEQINKGIIEVTIANSEPDDNSQPGEEGLVMPKSSDYYSQYGALTGWGKSS